VLTVTCSPLNIGSSGIRAETALSQSNLRRSPGAPLFDPAVDDRQHEQRERRGAEQTADDDELLARHRAFVNGLSQVFLLALGS
jgi:hypothetical protein